MADTALDEESIKEFYDSEEELELKCAKLAKLIKYSKHCSIYTGAGLSTSAGIRDFRGPDGVWTLKAKGQAPATPSNPNPQPTPTHMALAELLRRDLVKSVISQNTDGLHLKAGIPAAKLCELHGNSRVEACNLCGKCYYRGQRVNYRRDYTKLTGNMCTTAGCAGKLRGTVVAFDQLMPDLCLEKAEQFSYKTDIALCLGTSMRVKPACVLPRLGGGKLIIVNLQKTPYDDKCTIRIFAKIDDVFERVMRHLQIKIPEYSEKDRTTDSEWMEAFLNDWTFRSAPSNDWFKEETDTTK